MHLLRSFIANPFSQSWGFKIFVLLGAFSVHNDRSFKDIIKQWNPPNKSSSILYLCSWISENSSVILSFVFTITRYFHKYLLLILDISHIKYSLYQFSTATIKNYHKLINLKKFIILHFCWSDIRMSAGLFFPECSRGEMSPCLFQLLEITYIP